MSSHEKAIEELKGRIAENDEAIESQFRLLGETVVSLDTKTLVATPFIDHVSRIKNLQDEIADKGRTIKKWQDIERQLEVVKKNQKSVESDIASLKKEIEPSYEEIGSAALAESNESHLKFSEVEIALADLSTLEENIREKEREIQQLETGGKLNTFIGKTLAKGKGLVLKGSLVSQSVQKNRLLRGAGEKISEMEVPELPVNSSLSIAMGAIRPLLEELRKAKVKLTALEKKRTGLAEQKIEIEKNAHMRNPVPNLRHETERLEVQAGELREALGNLYLNTKSPGSAKDGATEESSAIINKLKKENEKNIKLIARYKAAVEVERLEKEIKQKRNRAANLEKELQKNAGEIDVLKEKREKQVQARGNLKTIILDGDNPEKSE
jgi:chromosome segregation ATPase